MGIVKEELVQHPLLVLQGGTSAEREISLQSGDAVAAALQQQGFSVQQVDPMATPVEAINWPADCIVVNMLHGTYGEDGQIQQALDELGLKYTGSGSAASHLAFHKHLGKEKFKEHRLPTPDWLLLQSPVDDSAIQSLLTQIETRLQFPVVVKPEAQGSSIGITVVNDATGLTAALNQAFQYDSQVLIEQAIIGEEWTVAIVNGVVLPPIRISSASHFFDYTAKYLVETTQYEFIDSADAPYIQSLGELSLQASQVLGTRGIVRVDLMVDAERNPWLLEVNTVPGMTDHSLVPKAARKHGWTMGELCEQNLRSALTNRTN